MKKPFVVAAVATAVTAATVAGVFLTRSPGVGVNTGPLGGGPVNGSVCFAGHQATTVSIDNFKNTSSSPIRVEKLTLVSARGLRLLGVDLVPIVTTGDGGDLLPNGGPWPPSGKDAAMSPDARWGERRTLPMSMPPDKPGHSWNLAFGLERIAVTGTADYQVQYEWQGNQYIWSARTSLKVATVPSQCTSAGSP